MGWASGSDLFERLIKALQPLTDAQRYDLYMKIIPDFQNMDWDTEDECRGLDPQFDKALTAIQRASGWNDDD